MTPQRLNKRETLNRLLNEWPTNLRPEIRQRVLDSQRTVVVLDDDPTGTQTVYDVPVLTEWSVATLQAELAQGAPVFYILTNSRSLLLAEAQALNTEIANNLQVAAQAVHRAFTVVSRSDSTLRGHYPGEVDSLITALGQVVDAVLIIPFFLEGGRYTLNDIHYVAEGDVLVPAAETPFAQDAAFGYTASNLREWVAEKTAGRILAETVTSIPIKTLRQDGPEAVSAQLMALTDGAVCVVNAASMRDLEVFTQGLLQAEARGKQFLYRTAASFVQVRAGLEARPILTKADLDLSASSGGLIVVGSYVPKTTSQLNQLLATSIERLAVDVQALLDNSRQQAEIVRLTQAVNSALSRDEDIVVYTSRQLATATDAETSLEIGQRISQSLVAIVQGVTTRPRYLLAKGGITASDIATQGLGVKRALVLGQILPGIPLWALGGESRYSGLPYIVFPGNVGDDGAIAAVVTKLK